MDCGINLQSDDKERHLLLQRICRDVIEIAENGADLASEVQTRRQAEAASSSTSTDATTPAAFTHIWMHQPAGIRSNGATIRTVIDAKLLQVDPRPDRYAGRGTQHLGHVLPQIEALLFEDALPRTQSG